MSTSMETSMQPRFRTIDGLKIPFAESDDRGEHALLVVFTVFPGEIFQAPRSWAEKVHPNLVFFHEVDRGGHFAAWEEPQLFADEMRAAFRTLREGG